MIKTYVATSRMVNRMAEKMAKSRWNNWTLKEENNLKRANPGDCYLDAKVADFMTPKKACFLLQKRFRSIMS